jgi:hypothetical protein
MLAAGGRVGLGTSTTAIAHTLTDGRV